MVLVEKIVRFEKKLGKNTELCTKFVPTPYPYRILFNFGVKFLINYSTEIESKHIYLYEQKSFYQNII